MKSNHIKLSKYAIEFLNGELLGDGCLITHNISAHYQHRTKHKLYLEWLSNKLESYGIEQVGRIYEYENPYKNYHYCSRRYVEFKEIYDKWYKNRIKIVPKDIELTPITIRQWYLGDGCLSRYKKYKSIMINLATNSYTFDENVMLIDKLSELGFECYYRKDNSITISMYSVIDFLDYIGYCPKEIDSIYGYKWITLLENEHLYKKMRKREFVKSTYQNKDWLLEQYIDKHKSIPKIGKEFNICPDSIWKGLKKFNIKRRQDCIRRNTEVEIGTTS